MKNSIAVLPLLLLSLSGVGVAEPEATAPPAEAPAAPPAPEEAAPAPAAPQEATPTPTGLSPTASVEEAVMQGDQPTAQLVDLTIPLTGGDAVAGLAEKVELLQLDGKRGGATDDPRIINEGFRIHGRQELVEKTAVSGNNKASIRPFSADMRKDSEKANETTLLKVINNEDVTNLYRSVTEASQLQWIENPGAVGGGIITKSVDTKRPASDYAFVYAQGVGKFKDTFAKPPRPMLIEFSTNQTEALKHCEGGNGYLVQVTVNGKYLNGASNIEFGWSVDLNAPITFVSKTKCKTGRVQDWSGTMAP